MRLRSQDGFCWLGLLLLAASLHATAGTWGERLQARRAADTSPVTDMRELAYGSDPLQRLDVYLPDHPEHAPVLLMVHGGAWRIGDKRASAVVANKLARWRPWGFIFVSVNYRLLPAAAPLQQAQDVARALAFTQQHAADWGGDGGKVILLGHSAGAHLVSLLAAAPQLAYTQGAGPWLGSVALDSAALDVEQLMQQPHARFYDRAFGAAPAYWASTSPLHQLGREATPLLAVCSSQRRDSCPPARRFVEQAGRLGRSAQLLSEDRSHRAINQDLGRANAYTQAVERFMAGLDREVARRLELAP